MTERDMISFITTMCLPPPLQPRFGSLRLLAFPKAKIAVAREMIFECDGDTVLKLSQQRITADWLVPREGGYSRIRNKVPSDWLPSYIKATWPVLEIFKMDGYFPGNCRTALASVIADSQSSPSIAVSPFFNLHLPYILFNVFQPSRSRSHLLPPPPILLSNILLTTLHTFPINSHLFPFNVCGCVQIFAQFHNSRLFLILHIPCFVTGPYNIWMLRSVKLSLR